MNYSAIILVTLMLGIQDAFSEKPFAPCFHQQRVIKQLKQATDRFFKSLQPGTCAQVILNSTVRKQYLSKTLIGRVEPAGTFLTPLTALEYWYGLACDIPGLPPKPSRLVTADILQLTYDPNFYRVSFKIQVNFLSSEKLTAFGILAFDEKFKLCGYDATLQNLGLTFDVPPDTHNATILSLCEAIQYFCPVNSKYKQYSNVSECVSFLTQIPFGSLDQGDQNNVACRSIHIELAEITPEIHCPHVGETGGGFCTNKTAASYFEGTTDFLKCAHRCA